MTNLKVDSQRRIRLGDAKPGQVFARTNAPDGSITLRPVKPVERGEAKVRIEKRGRFSVGVLDRPINEEALREALADFP